MFANRITSYFDVDADDSAATQNAPPFVMIPLPFLARPALAPACRAKSIHELAYEQAQAMIAARDKLRAAAHFWN